MPIQPTPDQTHPVLTITLNPTLDMSSDADHVVAEDKIRCDAPTLDPGGGGTNVARAIGILGGQATAMVALAGFRGQQVAALLERENVPHVVVDIPGETRLSLAVGDRTAHTQYRFVMPGPQWAAAQNDACLAAIKSHLRAGQFVVLSGSMPPGISARFIQNCSALVGDAGAQLVLDTTGGDVLSGDTPVFMLRLDKVESEAMAGRALPAAQDAATFAQGLIARGIAEMVVLGRGKDGSVLATEGVAWHGTGPDVTVHSKVGAGDSFLGAFTLALARGEAPQVALAHGVAAASAAVMSAATSLCSKRDFDALLPEITVTEI